MKGYAEINVFEQTAIHDYHKIQLVMQHMPDDPKSELRCHELARATQMLLAHMSGKELWEVKDGRFGAVDHSWLYSVHAKVILDVYAVGAMPMVQLHHDHFGLPTRYDERSLDAIQVTIDENLVTQLFNRMKKLWDL